MEDIVLSIPTQDAAFIETLAQRKGWTMRKRRTRRSDIRDAVHEPFLTRRQPQHCQGRRNQ